MLSRRSNVPAKYARKDARCDVPYRMLEVAVDEVGPNDHFESGRSSLQASKFQATFLCGCC